MNTTIDAKNIWYGFLENQCRGLRAFEDQVDGGELNLLDDGAWLG